MDEKPSRHFQRWTEDDLRQLARMVDAGRTNREIAQELGRTCATINAQKISSGLVVRRPDCLDCGRTLVIAPRGRPRQRCGDCRVRECQRAKQQAAQEARKAALEARNPRRCGNPSCTSILGVEESPARRFCVPACCEVVYSASGRRAARAREVRASRAAQFG